MIFEQGSVKKFDEYMEASGLDSFMCWGWKRGDRPSSPRVMGFAYAHRQEFHAWIIGDRVTPPTVELEPERQDPKAKLAVAREALIANGHKILDVCAGVRHRYAWDAELLAYFDAGTERIRLLHELVKAEAEMEARNDHPNRNFVRN